MTTRTISLITASLLAAGCNIQFSMPAFPVDTAVADTVAGDAGIDAVAPDLAEPDADDHDAVGPDAGKPDLTLPTCAEINGVCASPREPVERNEYGCPWGYEPDPAGVCPGDAVCCVVSPHCETAGDVFDVSAPGVGCCPGLVGRDQCEVLGFEACGCDGGSYICTDCGDGDCAEWENPCICQEDCPWKGQKCIENGGECVYACTGPEVLPFECDGGMLCCAPGAECLAEGNSAEDVPGSLPCCDGLTPIPMTQWYGGDDEPACEADEQFYVCSYCGDGWCQGWESPCTCQEDCKLIPTNVCVEEGGQCMNFCPTGWTPVDLPGCDGAQSCCFPNEQGCFPGSDIYACPQGEFCKMPPYTCWLDQPIGTCKPVPVTCTGLGDVCGCNEVTYQSECMADAAQEPVAYHGACGGDCLGLGKWGSTTGGSTAGCCGDLDMVPFGYPEGEGGDEGCTYPVGEYVCVKCGDGFCGPGENPCICANDCVDIGFDEPGGGG